jgi:hypothetical protein
MKQITVVSHGDLDITADLTSALGSAGINIETLALEHHAEASVVTLTVDRYDEALAALQQAGFDAVSEDALLIRVTDAPGSLARIALRFREAGIQVRSLRIIRHGSGHAIVAVSVDRTAQARELLRDVLLGEEPIPG